MLKPSCDTISATENAQYSHSRLPFDEGVVVQYERRTAEYHDDAEAHPQHRVDLAVAERHPRDLHQRGDDRHCRRRENAPDLEGDEEQDDREQIEQEFHYLVGKSESESNGESNIDARQPGVQGARCPPTSGGTALKGRRARFRAPAPEAGKAAAAPRYLGSNCNAAELMQ
ncbi:hypothetical protein QFZ91_001432 [Paraburkholderia sp. JPY419]